MTIDNTPSRRLRCAVIGVGAGVFEAHRSALLSQDVELAAVTDVNAEAGRRRAEELGCPFYTDHRDMLAGSRPELAVVLAPQPFHADIAVDCLGAGAHVLVEKPMATHLDDADAMIEAARRADRLLAVSFQRRYRPEVRVARRLIESGKLGDIQRVSMTVLWTRPAAYYEKAPWRGVASVRGGGLLMNQASHNLDMLCYLLGMPERVVAWTDTILHRVDAEDTVQAMLRWPGGALGSLYISTAGAGEEPNVLISGTGGQLRILPDGLEFGRFEVDLKEYAAREPEPFAEPPGLEPVEVDLEPGAGGHIPVYRDLREAVLTGSPLLVDGGEGRKSLELACAMIYSDFAHEEVALPLDRRRYGSMLKELGVVGPAVNVKAG